VLFAAYIIILTYSKILNLPTIASVVRNDFAYEYSKLGWNLCLSQVTSFVPSNPAAYSHKQQSSSLVHYIWKLF